MLRGGVLQIARPNNLDLNPIRKLDSSNCTGTMFFYYFLSSVGLYIFMETSLFGRLPYTNQRIYQLGLLLLLLLLWIYRWLTMIIFTTQYNSQYKKKQLSTVQPN